MENKEVWLKSMELNTQYLVLRLAISKMPVAYMSGDLGCLERDVEIRAKFDEVVKELTDFISPLGYLTKLDEQAKAEGWTFSFDDQRNAIEKVLGKRWTVEEVYKKYGLI